MNFFQDQRLAKKKTNQLLWLFGLTVLGTSIALGIFISILLSQSLGGSLHLGIDGFLSTQSLKIIFTVTLVTTVIILFISFIKFIRLKSKPESICYAIGAKKVQKSQADLKVSRYINIVEEMSIASSVPVPLIFVLEDDAINAFACGYDINSSAVCVTRGSLNNLNRDELQAVVAHEYSHILNGDMTINLKLIGMLAGLLYIYYAGRSILRSNNRSYSSRRNNKNGAAIGLGLIVIGFVGYFFGSLLKAAISRQREYLADASSVQFTRNPGGIVGALKKIAIHAHGGIISSPKADQASHMFLVDGINKSFFSMATHPDIFERIKAVDKNFNKQHFLKREQYNLLQKMEAEETRRDAEEEKKLQTPKDYAKAFLPLYYVLEKTPLIKESNDVEMTLLRELLKNDHPEIIKLSPKKKLESLEICFGEIKAMSKERKQEIHKMIKQQISADKKFDLNEFIIYAYLRPALIDIPIKTKSLSTKHFHDFANKYLQFLLIINKNKLNQKAFKEINEILPFKEKASITPSYMDMIKILDRLRFTNLDQKETLLKAQEMIIHYDDKVSSEEWCMVQIMQQILGIPGTVHVKRD